MIKHPDQTCQAIMKKHHSKQKSNIAQAGLPGADSGIEEPLRQAGIDPDRLSIIKFGQQAHAQTSGLRP
jgi:hypothetical protein